MTVARRLGIALGLHLLLLLGLVGYHLRTIRHAVTTAHDLSEVSAHLVLSSTRQASRINQLDDAAAKYAVTGDPGYSRQFERVRAEFSAELERWPALPATPDEARAVRTAIDAWRPLRTASIDSIDLVPLQSSMNGVSNAAQGTMQRRLGQATDDAVRAERLSYIAAAGALLFAILTAALLARSITAPLRRLAAGTREVALGRFGYRLDTQRGDEFAQVAHAFNLMTERLGALDRMKQDFVSSVSHDLKSPLASLRETTGIMLDGVTGPLTAQQRRLLLLQRESADRLGTMIAKLLDLSRLESGLPLSIAREPLSPLLAAAVAHAVTAGVERDVRVALCVPPDELHLHCDADRIRQLVDNLLENAIKFSPRGSLVEVTARVDDDILDIRVADRGPGVPEDQREKVFERFHQTEAGRSVPGRGVGLGLTISRQIVQAHRGEIGIEAREGGGSVFHVRMPGAERGEPVRAGSDAPDTGGSDAHRAPAAVINPAILLIALLVAGCSTPTARRFDDHLQAGRWTEAAAEFSRDSSLHEDPDALRQMADVHAVPQRPEWDPERAAKLYQEARLRSRGAWVMPLQSARSAALVEEVLRLRAAHAARERQLETAIAQADSLVGALRTERDQMARELATHQSEIESRIRQITRLERSLQEREAEARALREELASLKAIDLRPRSRRRPTDPV